MRNTTIICVRVPGELLEQTRMMADRQLISASAVIRQAIQSHVSKNNTKQHINGAAAGFGARAGMSARA